MSPIKQALHDVSRYVVKRAQNLFYFYETDISILCIAGTLSHTPKPVDPSSRFLEVVSFALGAEGGFFGLPGMHYT